jgi:hypothetical protein
MPTTARLSKLPFLVALALVASGPAAIGYWYIRGTGGDLPAEVENSLQLRSLPPNRWIKYHEERPRGWSRQGHAGIAFDSKRGTLLIFGSDTHGENWDNSVHEFDPRRKRWQTHQPPADAKTYRTDAAGAPVAGAAPPMPWAMHTYDSIEYHPALDALVVMSTTEHTPGGAAVTNVKRQPTWIYDLSTRQWRQFDTGGNASPSFFAGSSAFDAARGLLVAYRYGVWEMDSAAGLWRQASSEYHHEIHHTMVYDQRRRALFVFGDHRPTNKVWRYQPGAAAGERGHWIQHQPKGDVCPPGSIIPAAYAADQDVFVLVVDDATSDAAPGGRTASVSTCLYDPAMDTYTKLPAAELPAIGMNFMMAWDRVHEVVFLITGDGRGPVTVWAMKPGK